jgi:hypothetical protein
MVLGGIPPTGGSYVSSVERFDPVTREFCDGQEGLFTAETWLGSGSGSAAGQPTTPGRRPIPVPGPAHRESVTHYRLWTFDPQTAAIAPLGITPALPDSQTHTLWAPVVDTARGRAHLLAQVAGSNPPEIRLLSVELAAGTLTSSAQSHVLDPAYVLSGAGITLLADGRLFVTGGSADGSNFNPVRHTLLVTPAAAGAAAPSLEIDRPNGSEIEIVWAGQAGDYLVQESTNLIDWSTVLPEPIQDGDGLRITLPLNQSIRFFRLLPAAP